MSFKIKNFYQKPSPLSNDNNKLDFSKLEEMKLKPKDIKPVEMTHSGNPIPEGTVFYGEGEGSIPMPETDAEKLEREIEELLDFDPDAMKNNNKFNFNTEAGNNTNNDFAIQNINRNLQNINRGGQMPEGNQNEFIESVINPEVNKDELAKFREQMNLKNNSKVNWSEAPGVGTAERTAWYIANNLKLDHTTPDQVKEPVVDKIVEEEEKEVVAEERRPLNRRQRRALRIEERNDAKRLKRMGTSEEEIREGVKDNSFVIPEGDFQDPNIA